MSCEGRAAKDRHKNEGKTKNRGDGKIDGVGVRKVPGDAAVIRDQDRGVGNVVRPFREVCPVLTKKQYGGKEEKIRLCIRTEDKTQMRPRRRNRPQRKRLRRKEGPLDPSKLDYSDTGRITEKEN